jgi:hypothetical protein
LKVKFKILGAIVLAAGAGLVLLLVLAANPLLRWALEEVQAQLAREGYELSLGEISGHPLTELQVENISLSQAGTLLFRLQALRIKPRLSGFLEGRLCFALLELQQPEATYFAPPPGQEAEEAPRPDWPAVRVDELRLSQGKFSDGENVQMQGLELRGSLTLASGSLALELAEAEFFCPAAGPEAWQARGGLSLDSDSLTLENFVLAEGSNRHSAQGRLDWRRYENSALGLELV